MNMFQTIQAGAEATIAAERAQKRQACACPFCGEDPPLAKKVAARFIVGCENDDCPAQPQVSSATLADAWALWNRRAA